jgi:hypothetical protein
MGRRSRKRSRGQGGPAQAADPPPGSGRGARSSRAERDAARRRRAEGGGRPARRSRRGPTSERPPAPWGRFPLTEIVVLLALVLGVAGLVVGVEEDRGRTMFLAGLALGSLGGLELAIRDHFAGYRSHSTLLAAAGAAAAVIAVSMLLAAIGPGLSTAVLLLAALAVGALVFTLAFFRLRRVFQQRSGGLSFR